jgi:DNA-binding NtrC family response regulator
MAQSSPHFVLIAFSPGLAGRVLEVGAFLERFGFHVGTAPGAAECLTACGRAQVDAVVYDLDLVAGFGLEVFLDKLKLISPLTVPVAVGEHAQLEALRRSSQLGDGDYVLLPIHLPELKDRVKRLVDLRVPQRPDGERPASDGRGVDDLVGRSPQMQTIRERIRKVAGLSSTVLITGESGVGKELIARAIHRASPRRDMPFIAINCSALPENLLESELFGHEKGAFTGAGGLTKGKFELAHQGTLFLDEIGDMNPYTQAKILRVLEEKEFMRLGGSRNLRVDVRVVAATNADLGRRMAEGRFREDLFYRLKVLTIAVPPLRERPGDVAELSRSLIDRFSRVNGIPPKRLTDEALEALGRYHWPGNIRELRNSLENAVVTAPGLVIDVADLPAEVLGTGGEAAAPVRPGRAPADGPRAGGEGTAAASMEEMERVLIRDTLTGVGGNRTRAAGILKIGVRTLQRKIKRYGLEGVGR